MKRDRRNLFTLALAALLLTASMTEGATIAPVVSWVSPQQQTITWSGMAGTDTTTSARIPGCMDMSVQVTGTFGTTTVTMQGSLDDTTYATLDDAIGTPAALSFTAAAFKHVQQRSLFIKPGLSGGTGTGLQVKVLCTNHP